MSNGPKYIKFHVFRKNKLLTLFIEMSEVPENKKIKNV